MGRLQLVVDNRQRVQRGGLATKDQGAKTDWQGTRILDGIELRRCEITLRPDPHGDPFGILRSPSPLVC